MSPANIENTILAACPMVGVMMAIGDGRTYNTALLVFDADSLSPYAAVASCSPAAQRLTRKVMRASPPMAGATPELSRVEQVSGSAPGPEPAGRDN